MRRLFAILLTLTIVSCNTNKDTYDIEGIAQGFDDNTPVIVFTIENNQPKAIDTLLVQDGKFSGMLQKSDAANINYFNVAKYNGNVIFFPENDDLKVTLYKDSIQSSFVVGGNQNKAYTDFSRTLRDFNVQKQNNMARFKEAREQQDNLLVSQIQVDNKTLLAEEASYKKDFISKNTNSIFSVMLLSEMMSRKEMTAAEASEVLAKVSPKVAASEITVALKKNIAGMQKSEIGGLAPQFTAPTPEGTMLSLQETLGKYTIIDFWASWCRPCRAENPNVVRVYNKYHDKGLNIISVSLDKEGQRERWLKAIADDQMDWYHVSNLKSWKDPIAAQYGVRSIPATFLLDEQGKIIAKNLRGPALETKIASLLGQ